MSNHMALVGAGFHFNQAEGIAESTESQEELLDRNVTQAGPLLIRLDILGVSGKTVRPIAN